MTWSVAFWLGFSFWMVIAMVCSARWFAALGRSRVIWKRDPEVFADHHRAERRAQLKKIQGGRR